MAFFHQTFFDPLTGLATTPNGVITGVTTGAFDVANIFGPPVGFNDPLIAPIGFPFLSPLPTNPLGFLSPSSPFDFGLPLGFNDSPISPIQVPSLGDVLAGIPLSGSTGVPSLSSPVGQVTGLISGIFANGGGNPALNAATGVSIVNAGGLQALGNVSDFF